MPFALLLVAGILSLIVLVQSKGASLVGWALLCLSLALLWGRLPL